MIDFAARLDEIMKKRGLTQVALSKLTGIAQTTISQYLSRKRNPTVDVLLRFSRGLGVSADYLLGVIDEKEEQVRRMAQNPLSKKIPVIDDFMLDKNGVEQGTMILDLVIPQDREADFAVVVKKGMSMIDELSEGDIAIIRRSREAVEGFKSLLAKKGEEVYIGMYREAKDPRDGRTNVVLLSEDSTTGMLILPTSWMRDWVHVGILAATLTFAENPFERAPE
jgi:transcriptional regulator with XRE-family HTH domain